MIDFYLVFGGYADNKAVRFASKSAELFCAKSSAKSGVISGKSNVEPPTLNGENIWVLLSAPPLAEVVEMDSAGDELADPALVRVSSMLEPSYVGTIGSKRFSKSS